MSDFRSERTDHIRAGSITNPTTWNTMTAAVSNLDATGNTNGISVSVSPTAAAGSTDIRVVQAAQGDLVRGAQFNGTATTANGTDGRRNVSLDNSIAFFMVASATNNSPGSHYDSTQFTGSSSTTVRIGNADITINENDSVQEFMDRVNRSATAGVTMAFDAVRGVFTIESKGMGADAVVQTGDDRFGVLRQMGLANIRSGEFRGNELPGTTAAAVLNTRVDELLPASAFANGDATTITVGGVSTYVHRSNTLNDIQGAINNEPHLNIHLDLDTHEFVLRIDPDFVAANPGTQVTGSDGFGLLARLGLENITNETVGESDNRFIRTAQNAVIYHDINNALGGVRMEQENNAFEINGVNINITGAAANKEFNISVTRNVDDVVNSIREFVESYNDLIRYLNSLHSTARPRAGNSVRGAFFEPLTDEQRQAMSDREIERWEEQARTGLLHRDGDIRRLQQQLRDAMFNPVILARNANGTPTDQIALFNIGITTIGRNGPPGDQLIGVLQIDENRLRAELEKDPERVRKLFSNNTNPDGDLMPWGTMEQRNARTPFAGVANRVDDILNTAASDDRGPFRQRAGASSGLMVSENMMTRQLRDYDRRIEQMQQFLVRRENHFFNMFAKMEQAMAQSNAQMDSLFAFMMQ
jgi:flagellar capping protein FliD